MTFSEYFAAWHAKAKERGHDLATYADRDPEEAGTDYGNTIDDFAGTDSGFHHGPLCKRCDWTACMHCVGLEAIPECSA